MEGRIYALWEEVLIKDVVIATSVDASEQQAAFNGTKMVVVGSVRPEGLGGSLLSKSQVEAEVKRREIPHNAVNLEQWSRQGSSHRQTLP